MVKEGTTGIYAIINMIDWKKYIGQAVDIKRRNNKELSILRGNYFHNQHLQNAFNKYGEENFIFIFLEECTEEKLNERERYHIKAAGWPDHEICYNDDEGGKSGGRKHPETIEKYRVANTGDKHFTKKMTSEDFDEYCQKLSDALKGRVFTQEHKDNLSKACKGPRPERCGENHQYYNKKRPDISEGQLGSKNHMAILTEDDIIDIKTSLLKFGHINGFNTKIADIYGVDSSVINAIKSGTNWSQIKVPGWINGIKCDKKRPEMSKTQLGSKNPNYNHMLDNSKEKILFLYYNTDFSLRELAKLFNTNLNTISKRIERWS